MIKVIFVETKSDARGREMACFFVFEWMQINNSNKNKQEKRMELK